MSSARLPNPAQHHAPIPWWMPNESTAQRIGVFIAICLSLILGAAVGLYAMYRLQKWLRRHRNARPAATSYPVTTPEPKRDQRLCSSGKTNDSGNLYADPGSHRPAPPHLAGSTRPGARCSVSAGILRVSRATRSSSDGGAGVGAGKALGGSSSLSSRHDSSHSLADGDLALQALQACYKAAGCPAQHAGLAVSREDVPLQALAQSGGLSQPCVSVGSSTAGEELQLKVQPTTPVPSLLSSVNRFATRRPHVVVMAAAHPLSLPAPPHSPPSSLRVGHQALFESYHERDVEQRLRRVIFGSFLGQHRTAAPLLAAPLQPPTPGCRGARGRLSTVIRPQLPPIVAVSAGEELSLNSVQHGGFADALLVVGNGHDHAGPSPSDLKAPMNRNHAASVMEAPGGTHYTAAHLVGPPQCDYADGCVVGNSGAGTMAIRARDLLLGRSACVLPYYYGVYGDVMTEPPAGTPHVSQSGLTSSLFKPNATATATHLRPATVDGACVANAKQPVVVVMAALATTSGSQPGSAAQRQLAQKQPTLAARTITAAQIQPPAGLGKLHAQAALGPAAAGAESTSAPQVCPLTPEPAPTHVPDGSMPCMPCCSEAATVLADAKFPGFPSSSSSPSLTASFQRRCTPGAVLGATEAVREVATASFGEGPKLTRLSDGASTTAIPTLSSWAQAEAMFLTCGGAAAAGVTEPAVSAGQDNLSHRGGGGRRRPQRTVAAVLAFLGGDDSAKALSLSGSPPDLTVTPLPSLRRPQLQHEPEPQLQPLLQPNINSLMAASCSFQSLQQQTATWPTTKPYPRWPHLHPDPALQQCDAGTQAAAGEGQQWHLVDTHPMHVGGQGPNSDSPDGAFASQEQTHVSWELPEGMAKGRSGPGDAMDASVFSVTCSTACRVGPAPPLMPAFSQAAAAAGVAAGCVIPAAAAAEDRAASLWRFPSRRSSSNNNSGGSSSSSSSRADVSAASSSSRSSDVCTGPGLGTRAEARPTSVKGGSEVLAAVAAPLGSGPLMATLRVRPTPLCAAAGEPEGLPARCVAERIMTCNPLFRRLDDGATPEGVDSGAEDEH